MIKKVLACLLIHPIASSVWLLQSIKVIFFPKFQIWRSSDIYIFVIFGIFTVYMEITGYEDISPALRAHRNRHIIIRSEFNDKDWTLYRHWGPWKIFKLDCNMIKVKSYTDSAVAWGTSWGQEWRGCGDGLRAGKLVRGLGIAEVRADGAHLAVRMEKKRTSLRYVSGLK